MDASILVYRITTFLLIQQTSPKSQKNNYEKTDYQIII